MTFEGAVKGGLGLVAHFLGDPHQGCVAIAQLVRGELDAPARQVAHRRFADQPREALRERRTRQTNFTSKVVDRPRLGHAPVKKCPECGGTVEQLLSAPSVQFKGSGWYVTDYARKGSSESSAASESLNVMPQAFDEQQFGYFCQHGSGAGPPGR